MLRRLTGSCDQCGRENARGEKVDAPSRADDGREEEADREDDSTSCAASDEAGSSLLPPGGGVGDDRIVRCATSDAAVTGGRAGLSFSLAGPLLLPPLFFLLSLCLLTSLGVSDGLRRLEAGSGAVLLLSSLRFVFLACVLLCIRFIISYSASTEAVGRTPPGNGGETEAMAAEKVDRTVRCQRLTDKRTRAQRAETSSGAAIRVSLAAVVCHITVRAPPTT